VCHKTFGFYLPLSSFIFASKRSLRNFSNKALNIGILNNLENDLSDVGLSEVSETPEEEEKQKTSSCGYTFSDKIDFKNMDFISRKIVCERIAMYSNVLLPLLKTLSLCCQ
jgi:hypothetical protein